MTGMLFRRTMALALVFGFGVLVPSIARADEVLDWNAVLQRALFVSNTPGFTASRVAAIVHGAIFDAVNGIERRYTRIHVTRGAPRGASRRAAAVQAAYATLVKLYPSQKSTFDQQRAASLADIRAAETSYSVVRGIAWGQIVANAIFAWRSSDGFD